MTDPRPCLQCSNDFTPRRTHQKFCGKACRVAHHETHQSTNGTAATVKSLRVLKSGKVAAVMHFALDERERALRLTPGQAVSVSGHAADA